METLKLPLSALLAVTLWAGCAALRDDLTRAENAFDDARYEDSLVWLRDLEPQLAELEPMYRARYYYLRGTSAFRLGDRAEARHFLALCHIETDQSEIGLRSEWRKNLGRMLAELDPAAFGSGEERAKVVPGTSGGEQEERPPGWNRRR